jgi:hypothetical protein
VATLRSSANTDGDRSRCFGWLTKGLRPHRLGVVVIRRDTCEKRLGESALRVVIRRLPG